MENFVNFFEGKDKEIAAEIKDLARRVNKEMANIARYHHASNFGVVTMFFAALAVEGEKDGSGLPKTRNETK